MSVGDSKRSALPPPGCFITRSAISQSSRSSETGSAIRTSSPASSSASTNCFSESNATLSLDSGVNGRDAEGQGSPMDVHEASRLHPLHQLGRARKVGHRFGKVAIGSGMSAYRATDRRQHAVKIEMVEPSHDRIGGRRELENHEPRSRREHAMDFAEGRIEINDVADP